MVVVMMVKRVVLLAVARAAVRVLTVVGRELPLGESGRRELVERVSGALLGKAS